MYDIAPANYADNKAIYRPMRSLRGGDLGHSDIGRDVRPVKLGEALLGYREHKFSISGPFHHLRGRLREIEKLIAHRYGAVIPETDDAVIYPEVVAALLNVQFRDLTDKYLPQWCRRYMPWASAKFVDQIFYTMRARYTPLSADQIGRMLHVSYAERCALDLRTIGAFDVTKRQRTKLQKAKRRIADQVKKEKARRAAGQLLRAEYLANSKSRKAPWLALGISRRTWERRQNLGKNAQIGVLDAS